MRDQPKQSRRTITRGGFTLIEMLGTLSLLLVLGVSAVSILGAITEIGVRTNEDRQGRISIERLAQTLRDDVHRATEIELSDDKSKLTITTASTSIHYGLQQSPPAVFRRVVHTDSKTAYDRYPLPPACLPTAVLDGKRVVLRLNSEQNVRRLIIEASQP